VVESN